MNRVAGGLVDGPTQMYVRPIRPGETTEKLVSRDGTVTDLGGILELYPPDGMHITSLTQCLIVTEDGDMPCYEHGPCTCPAGLDHHLAGCPS